MTKITDQLSDYPRVYVSPAVVGKPVPVGLWDWRPTRNRTGMLRPSRFYVALSPDSVAFLEAFDGSTAADLRAKAANGNYGDSHIFATEQELINAGFVLDTRTDTHD